MLISRLTVVLFVLSLTGCFAAKGERYGLQKNTDVFGVELYSGADFQEIRGVKATEEPCLKGYERSYDTLDISIGYGFDKKIRKISTRNPGTKIFGITPGISAEEGKSILQQRGLQASGSPFGYQGDGFSLTLLVDGKGKIFGILLEADD